MYAVAATTGLSVQADFVRSSAPMNRQQSKLNEYSLHPMVNTHLSTPQKGYHNVDEFSYAVGI